MSKCTEIKDFCGDYAFEVEYSENNKFTMFFNSRRNAETVRRCIEIDDSVPNAATAVDFVEVVRCKDCKFATELDKHCDINRTAYKHCSLLRGDETKNVWHKYKKYYKDYSVVSLDDFCSCGEGWSE